MTEYKSKDFVLKNDNRGIVAIFSVVVIMGLLGILILGFSGVVRQAQRRVLDDHLYSQAYYAAESGVNMAVSQLAIDPSFSKSDCQSGGPIPSYVIDAANNISISCLLVNNKVMSYQTNNHADNTTTGYIESADEIKELGFTLSPMSGYGLPDSYSQLDNATGAPRLPRLDQWGYENMGALKVELVPANAIANRDDLINNSYIFYIYPSLYAPNIYSIGPANKGAVRQALCSNGVCTGSLALSGPSHRAYYIRLTALYSPVVSSFELLNETLYPGNAMEIIKSQAVIDVTGKANDIMRRIQVRVPIDEQSLSGGTTIPFAIFSGDRLCKQQLIYEGTSTPYSDGCDAP